MMEVIASMFIAATLIAIILVGGGSRFYFRRKFDVTPHLDAIDKAVNHQKLEKRKLHNVSKQA